MGKKYRVGRRGKKSLNVKSLPPHPDVVEEVQCKRTGEHTGPRGLRVVEDRLENEEKGEDKRHGATRRIWALGLKRTRGKEGEGCFIRHSAQVASERCGAPVSHILSPQLEDREGDGQRESRESQHRLSEGRKKGTTPTHFSSTVGEPGEREREVKMEEKHISRVTGSGSSNAVKVFR